jgi:hypothetical protein
MSATARILRLQRFLTTALPTLLEAVNPTRKASRPLKPQRTITEEVKKTKPDPETAAKSLLFLILKSFFN